MHDNNGDYYVPEYDYAHEDDFYDEEEYKDITDDEDDEDGDDYDDYGDADDFEIDWPFTD